jgi:cobalt/nickel transport system ATP-binding protein
MPDSILKLQGVTFAYPGHEPVLHDLNLSLAAGEKLGLLGANGSGKTTLLHLLVGLHRPAAGQVFAFGKTRATEKDFHEVRLRAGLLFQDSDDQLFCPTVAEDVAFGLLNCGCCAMEAEEKALDTLRGLGLEGYEQRLSRKLSFGEKRLVALATILAMNPDALLLDEPTNGLDETSRARLLEILRQLPQALLIVSHDREFAAELAHREVRLVDGRAVSS